MKVLLVHDYSSLDGGAEAGTCTLRRGLIQRGFDARIFAAKTDRNDIADYLCYGTKGKFRTALQTANPSAVRVLRQVLRDFCPDVVHVRMFLTQLSPLILPLLREIPAIYHAVWYRAACPKGTKLLPNGESCQNAPGLSCLRERCLPPWDWAALMAQMWMFERWRGAFDAVVANSRSVQGRLREVGISADVIWNGVPERGIRGDLSAEPVAGFAGRLVKEKGVDLLLRAFAQVPQGRLIVAGDGPERASLVNLAAALGLERRVSFLGQLSQSELERHFNSIWVQVIPSLWAEPFGFVAAEAMMRGSAVIASSGGGLGDVVQHNYTGLLVPPGEAEPLRQSLSRLFDDRSLVERMGTAGREFAKAHLHESVMVDHFVELYTRLIESDRKRRPNQSHS